MINKILGALGFRLCNNRVLADQKSGAAPDLENRDFC